MIVGFHEVDSRELHNIKELKTAIASAASQLPQMGEPMPAAWQRVRDEIRQLRDQEKQVQISFEEFQELCAKQELQEDAVRALSNLMNDLGDVVYFSESAGLSSHMILNPEWLTRAIGYVLEDKPTNDEAGVLAWSRLHEIWSSNRPDREPYETWTHPFFLRLMEQFDISYRLGNETSLVSQLVPADEPPRVQQFRDATFEGTETTLIARLSAQAPGLIAWLIVRTSWYSRTPPIHWQDGMLLDHPPHGEALIEQTGRNLRITVRADFPTYSLDILKDTVDFLIKDRWPGLTHRWAVPCSESECAGLLNLSVLRSREEGEHEKANCPECGEDLQIADLLVGVPPQPVFKVDDGVAAAQDYMDATEGLDSRMALALRILRKIEGPLWYPRYITCLERQPGQWVFRAWCEMPGCEHPVAEWPSDDERNDDDGPHPSYFVETAPLAPIVKLALRHAALVRTVNQESEIPTELSRPEEREFDWPTESDRPQLGFAGSSFAESGALTPVNGSDGRNLWVCSAHRKRFDPGLPEIPAPVSETAIRPFSLRSVRVQNFRNIDELLVPLPADSDLSGTWTCLAGINGAGKTAILEAIALVMLGPEYANQVGEKRLGRMVRRVDGNRRSELEVEVDWPGVGSVRLSIAIVLDENNIDARVPSAGGHDEHKDSLPRQLRLLARKHLFLSYGATRNLSDERDPTEADDAEIVLRQRTLFRPLAHIHGVNALLAGGEENSPALNTVRAMLQELFDREQLDPAEPTGDGPLTFSQLKAWVEGLQLPDGYRSTVGWLADLCSEWHRVNPEAAAANNFEQMSGLVLVDEIDLHLHPSLQRSLVPKLRRLLPNVQFIVTTHSPMVLTSFDQHELVLLEQQDGKPGIRNMDRQIVGFTMNEVYRWLLGPGNVSGGELALLEQSDDPGDQELVTRLLYQSDEVSAEEAERRLEAHAKLVRESEDEQGDS